MKIEINGENIRELWELYDNYKNEFYKRYYSDVKCMDFVEFVNNEVVKCSNCGCYITNDELGTNELAITDVICEDCMQDGYGT